MVNEGFLDFFKKSQPTDVVTQPVAQKVTEPKIIVPKKNVYADQFVKIFDKLNEMATKNGFKESKRYIEQESGLSHFVNYVVFEKGSRKIDIKYSWDKSLVVGKFNITVQDNGVDEYKIAKEVSQKEIPTVVGELFSTKITVPREKEDFDETTRIEELKNVADENGWKYKKVFENSYIFTKKGFIPFLFKLKHSINGEVNSTIEIGKKGSASFSPLDAYDLISHLLKTGELLNKFLIHSYISKDDKNVSNDVEVDYSDSNLTREKERSPRIKIKPTIEPKTEDVPKEKINPKEHYNKLFDFDLIQTTAINKGWKVDVEENKDTNKFDSILFTRGDEDIVVIPHEDKGNVTIETTKGSTNVEFKYVKKVLTDLIKNPLPKTPLSKPEVPIKLKQVDYEKLFRFNEVTQIAKQAGWKQTIPVAPSSDTSNKYYAKFTKDNNEILFKPHDKTSGEEGRSSLLVNGKLSFLPYKDVYKKLTTLLNK